ADHLRALRVGAGGPVAAVEHRVDDAAVDGVETVPHIRQRAADDHAHRVVEVGALRLLVRVALRDPVGSALVGRIDQGHGAVDPLGGGHLGGAVGTVVAERRAGQHRITAGVLVGAGRFGTGAARAVRAADGRVLGIGGVVGAITHGEGLSAVAG